MTNKKIEKLIIESCLQIARKGEGALIVLGGNPKYKNLQKQDVKKFNIKDNPKLFESISAIDGSVILDEEGNVNNYGVMIRSNKILRGFGTRHAGGVSASLMGAKVFLVSQEEKKVKIFKEGKLIMEIDALAKNIEKKVSEISNILESAGVSSLAGVGAFYLGMIGVTALSGVIVFGGGAYYLLKKLGIITNEKENNN